MLNFDIIEKLYNKISPDHQLEIDQSSIEKYNEFEAKCKICDMIFAFYADPEYSRVFGYDEIYLVDLNLTCSEKLCRDIIK